MASSSSLHASPRSKYSMFRGVVDHSIHDSQGMVPDYSGKLLITSSNFSMLLSAEICSICVDLPAKVYSDLSVPPALFTLLNSFFYLIGVKFFFYYFIRVETLFSIYPVCRVYPVKFFPLFNLGVISFICYYTWVKFNLYLFNWDFTL